MSSKNLLAAREDGRTRNVRHTQNELFNLYNGLMAHKDALCSSLLRSGSYSESEADLEFFSALDVVRSSYEAIDFEASMRGEYLVATGKDNIKKKSGVGLVGIRPQKHSRFYSVVDPLSAAIAGGNCVLLELNEAFLPLDSLLSTILSQSLDQETFQVTQNILASSDASDLDLMVDQGLSHASSKTLTCSVSTQSVALLDRSADVALAAKSIVDARLFMNGASPYAPDLVLVNDFMREAFGAACRHYIASQESQKTRSNPELVDISVQDFLRSRKSDGIIGKDNTLKTSKTTGTKILILRCSSLTHGLSLLDSLNTPFMATYVFSSPKTAKFMSEQIPSAVTYINQIPIQLLLGPPSPLTHRHQLHPRYVPDMFTRPSPQIIERVTSIDKTILALKDMKHLKPTGQRPGHAIGFFEQGILIGLTVSTLVIVPLVGFGLSRIWRRIWLP